jgi:hypothetical protein
MFIGKAQTVPRENETEMSQDGPFKDKSQKIK